MGFKKDLNVPLNLNTIWVVTQDDMDTMMQNCGIEKTW